MPFPGLQTRIEQARAFHGDDFALIAVKCGCTEQRVRDVIAAQDETAFEDGPVLVPTVKIRRAA